MGSQSITGWKKPHKKEYLFFFLQGHQKDASVKLILKHTYQKSEIFKKLLKLRWKNKQNTVDP